MSYQIYGDSSYYMEIARVNKLANINAIKPGDQLYFPPLKK
jgi:nucleoid-associated protein YgaU